MAQQSFNGTLEALPGESKPGNDAPATLPDDFTVDKECGPSYCFVKYPNNHAIKWPYVMFVGVDTMEGGAQK